MDWSVYQGPAIGELTSLTQSANTVHLKLVSVDCERITERITVMTRKKQKIEILRLDNWIVEIATDKMKVRENSGRRNFTLQKAGVSKWKLSGMSSKGSRHRETFGADHLEGAVQHSISRLYGIVKLEETSQEPLNIAQAMDRAIRASHGQEENKKNLRRYAKYFINWAQCEKLYWWHEIRRSHVDTYINSLVERKLKRKTILNYLEPIRMTGNRMCDDDPALINPTRNLRLRTDLGKSHQYDDLHGHDALSIEEVLEFADWLSSSKFGRILRVGVLISGLMGMRQREVGHLTWSNVDMINKTVTIQEETEHKPKNTYSVRRHPLPENIYEELANLPRSSKTIIDFKKLRKLRGCEPAESITDAVLYYTHLVRIMMNQWRPGIKLSGKDLRNTLQTTALDNPLEWNKSLVDRFCGHSPKSMMERHYFADRNSRLLQLYREQVIPMIDKQVTRFKMAKKDNEGQKFDEKDSSSSLRIIDMNELSG